MSIATKLAELTQIRTDIRTALTGKGVSASDHDFADFSTDIASISTGGTKGKTLSYYGDVNGVIETAIRTSASSWLKTNETYAQGKTLNTDFTDYIFNPASATSSFRIIVRFRMQDNTTDHIVVSSGRKYGGNDQWYGIKIAYTVEDGQGARLLATWMDANNTASYFGSYYAFTTNWYYAVFYYNAVTKDTTFSIYNDDLTQIQTETRANKTFASNTTYPVYIGGVSSSYYGNKYTGTIDVSNIVYEVDGTAQWGATNSDTATLGIPI